MRSARTASRVGMHRVGRILGYLPDMSTPFLLGTFTLFLVVYGLVMTLSASTVYSLQTTGSAYTVFVRQFVWVLIGSGLLAAMSSIDPRIWRKLAIPVLAVSVALLVLVLIPGLGIEVYGSSRWLGAGIFRMQPSELAKLGVVLTVALFLERKYRLLDDPVHLMIPVLAPIGVVVAVLLLLEPDYGTTIIVGGIIFTMMFLGGARAAHLAWTGAGLVSVGAVLMVVASYRLDRLLVFLDPWSDPQGKGYQVVQSLIAIGSGGPDGLGLGASRQKWMFLPNAHTDFVYSIVAEELGLVGSFAVLVLMFGLVFACVRAARRAPDRFGSLVAGGVGTWIGLQALLNLAGVTSLAPVDGVPLPLMSVGGSNACVLMIAIGLVMAIAREGDRALARDVRAARKRGDSTTDLGSGG